MNTEGPSIEIVIPNWNGIHLLVHCLDSLRLQTCQDFSITVVDNGSTDDSVSVLERDYPEVKIIRFQENRGFSTAVNAGIRGANAGWILLLNNDMEVEPNCLNILKGHVTGTSPYDFFALRMVNFHSRSLLDGAGDEILRGGVGYRIGTLENYGPPYDADREVFGACAGAALYNKQFFNKVGLFDEDFFAYLEDVDLNLRACHAGCRCFYSFSAIVYHIGSATSGSKINPLTVRLSTRNNLLVLIKNYPFSLILRFFPVIWIYQFFWLLFVIKKGKLLPYLLGLFQIIPQISKTLKKRRQILNGSIVQAGTFGSLLTSSEAQVVASIMARRTAEGKGNRLLTLYCKMFL
jgi:GT2 family glycosyltransferase